MDKVRLAMRQAAMLLTMLCGTALAGNVTSSEAKKKALQFMPGKQFKQMKLQGNRSLSRSADGSEASLQGSGCPNADLQC